MRNNELAVNGTISKNKYTLIFKACLIIISAAFTAFIYILDTTFIIGLLQKCFYFNNTEATVSAEEIGIYLLRTKIYLPLGLISYWTLSNYKNFITNFIFKNMKKIGFILIITGIFLLVNFGAVYQLLFDFATRVLSPEHYITESTKHVILTSGIFLCLSLGTALTINQLPQKIIQFIITDKYKMSSSIYTLPTIIGIILTLLYYTKNIHFTFLYYHENFFETITTSLYVCSVILLMCVFNKMNTKEVVFGILCSLLFIFLLLEEISFGQRLFNIEVYGIFEKYNYQNETNFHNFFNPYFDYLYPMFGLIFLTVNIALINRNIKKYIGVYVPHASLIPLLILIVVNSVGNISELTEELLPLYLFFYSYRINKIIRLK